MTNLYKKATAVATTLLLSLFLLPACSDNEGGGPDIPEARFAKVVITIQASPNSSPMTKAETVTPGVEEEEQYERRIDKCWVVLFNSENIWVATAATDKFTINNNHSNSESTTSIELPIGTYKGYAFANLHNLEAGKMLTDILESGKVNDSQVLTIEYLNSLTASLGNPAKFKLSGGAAIPMSSYVEDILVQESANNEANIGMFRMLGKVEITVTNQTSDPLTLKNLSMGSFRNGPIYLLPYKSGELTLDNVMDKEVQNQLQPTFPESTTAQPYSHTIALTDENKSIAIGGQQTYSFYAFETGTETNTVNADFSVTIGVNDRPVSTKETGFSFMRRNDWLKIPIVITNIETIFRFENTRIPIGGLPYQIVYGNPNGYQLLVDAKNEVPSDYAGPVKVEFELKSISNGSETLSGLNIVYSGTAVQSPWSTAELTQNEQNLIIDKATGLPIEVTSGNEPKIQLNASPVDPNNTEGEKSKTKGYFEVWTQELSKNSDATIKLTLVAEYGNDTPKKKIEIPYTIRIQNYKKTTTKGGNS